MKNMSFESFENRRYGCKILLHRNGFAAADAQRIHHWTGFRFEQYNKYRQWFRYRAALIQVQHPKQYVEVYEYHYQHVPEKEEMQKRLQNKLKSAKAKHTEYTNKMNRARQGWKELFPIEDHPAYQKAMEKVQEKQMQIIELQKQIDAL